MWWIVVLMLVGLRGFLMLNSPLGISVEQAGLGFGLNNYYLVSFLGWVIVIFIWGFKRPKTALVVACSLWLLQIATFNIQYLLILGVLGLVVRMKKGWKFGVGIVGVLILQLFLMKELIISDGFVEKIKPSVVRQQTNLVLNENYLASGRSYIIPGVVRRTLYSYPFVVGEMVGKKIISGFDLNLWTAPMDSYELIKHRNVGPKAFLPMLYFWELLIVVVSVINFSDKKRLLGLLGVSVVPLIFVEIKYLPISLVMFLGLLWMVIGEWVEKKSVLKNLVLGLYVVFAGFTYVYVHTQELNYRMSQPYLYQQVYRVINELGVENKYVVTSRFGGMQQMLDYYGVNGENVEVREIKPDEDKNGKVFIGLPGEFEFKDEKIVKKIETPDELVYKFGNGLWVRAN